MVIAPAALDVPLLPTQWTDHVGGSDLLSSVFQGARIDGGYYSRGNNGLESPAAYNSAIWFDFDFDDIYPPGVSIGSATLKMALRAPPTIFGSDDPTRKTYLFFEVRRRVDDSVLGTHGSSGAPLDFGNGATTAYGVDLSVSVPEIATTDDMNDLYIRVWAWGDPDPFGITNFWRLDHLVIETTVAGYTGTAKHFAFVDTWHDGIDSVETYWAVGVDNVKIQTRQFTADTDGLYMKLYFTDHGLEPPAITAAKLHVGVNAFAPDTGSATSNWKCWAILYNDEFSTELAEFGDITTPAATFSGTATTEFDIDVTSALTAPHDLTTLRVALFFATDTNAVRLEIDQVALLVSYNGP